MKKIRVPLSERTYDVLVGRDIAANPSTWKHANFEYCQPSTKKGRFGHYREAPARALIFADARLIAHERSLVRALRSAGWKPEVIRVVASEKLKDFSRIYPLYGKLLRSRADRRCVLFALGGGTIGDAVGFIAGTFLRGVRWVGVPTTLLAQVDSAIGGKTGINHTLGKNLIGVFHQPSLVVCDTGFLESLSSRDRLSGLGEMIKYGLIYDPRLWRLFVKRWRDILALKPDITQEAIAACVRWKAQAVSRDERDVLGVREALNFGHTVGHALEALTRFDYFRHGEAVLWGMRAAASLSWIRGHLERSAFAKIDGFLSSFHMPKIPASVNGRRILGQIGFDKKACDGKVRFVLLKKIGKVVLDSNVQDREFMASLQPLGIKP